MAVLSSKHILQEKNTKDPSTITSLTLTYKALTDVSCLAEFKNLERLDLGFNNLSSLEGLKSCMNLKWLSVIQNKLESLKGIEALTNLTVFNAGKNKLKSVNEVKFLVRLRALILNDNEIVSLCRLDQMKDLNTLVLSKNPIHKIGESLAKVESMTKLSLSHCKLQAIDFSLGSCTELKELRLAHNEITNLPVELVHNVKLQNLDLGNNLITRKSDLRVLASLVNLRNLNLQGNPIAENGKLPQKIKQLVPNLQIYNAKPIEKNMKNESGRGVDVFSLDSGKKPVIRKEEQTDVDLENKSLKHHAKHQSKAYQFDNAGDADMDTELKLTNQKRKELSKEKASNSKKSKVNKKLVQENQNDVIGNGEIPHVNPDLHKELKHKKQKRNEGSKVMASEELETKPKKAKRTVVSVIDDGDTPLTDILAADTAENAKNSGRNKMNNKIKDPKMADVVVTFPKKKKKSKNWITGSAALQALAPTTEVGWGGTSTWDD